ncbi:MAG: hypothetical protein H7124_17135 [Phycisphaerales bacterium]|nr:hypothetical protein [Hyphomonadaceae bacterium]
MAFVIALSIFSLIVVICIVLGIAGRWNKPNALTDMMMWLMMLGGLIIGLWVAYYAFIGGEPI